MKKTLQVLLLAGAVFMPAQAQLTQPRDSGPGPQLGDYFLQGTVIAIEKDSFTVSASQDNQKVLVKVDEHALILRQTQRQPVKIEPVKLDNIRLGETIVVRGSMQAGSLQATRIIVDPEVTHASLPPGQTSVRAAIIGPDALIKPEDLGKKFIDGRVEAVRADGLTIVWWNAQAKEITQEVKFDQNTTFRWGAEPLTSRDIRVGDHISGPGELKDNVFVAKTLYVMTSQNPAKRSSQPEERKTQENATPAGATSAKPR